MEIQLGVFGTGKLTLYSEKQMPTMLPSLQAVFSYPLFQFALHAELRFSKVVDRSFKTISWSSAPKMLRVKIWTLCREM